MAKKAVEHIFTGTTTPIASYSSSLTNLGPLMRQYTGATAADKFAGPMKIALARPSEASTAINCAYPAVHTWSSTLDYILLSENSTAQATRRYVLYEFNKSTEVFNWRGFITATFPATTSHTVRGSRLLVYTYSTGTVQVAGTAVTGTSTAWSTARFAVGARIGFGTTDPTAVTNWYEISAIGSDTSITLSATAGTIAAGTAFVIEEWRIATVTTNATLANGGLNLIKGLNPSTFSSGGTTISAAVSTDNVRAVYWLADAASVTNQTSAGIDTDAQVDNTTHLAYVLDGASTTAKIFVYNLRAALSVASGKSTSAFSLATGNQTVTGNISQNNNGIVWTAGHGAGNGVKSFYFVTTTRICRAPVASITSGNTTYVADSMTENPPGGTATFAAPGVMSAIDYDTNTDRMYILSTGSSGARSYITQYSSTGGLMESIWLVDTRQQDQSTEDSAATPFPNHYSTLLSMYISDLGIAYIIRNTTSATTNQMYALPIAAHWATSATSTNRIITPVLTLPGCTAFYRVYVNNASNVGGTELGVPPEPCRLSYRTSNFTDATSSWTQLDYTGDLTGVAAASTQIQFMFDFKIAGLTCVPGRIYSVTVLYEDSDSIPSTLEWSFADSNNGTGTVGFTQISTFGGSVPTFTIKYYRADTNALVLTQASSGTTNGTFQYYNGSTWTDGTGTDAAGTRRRFVPGTGILPVGVDLYMKISTA